MSKKFTNLIFFLSFTCFFLNPAGSGFAQEVTLDSGERGFISFGENINLVNKPLNLRDNAVLFGNQNSTLSGISALNIDSGAEMRLAVDIVNLRGGVFSNLGLFEAGLSTMIFELLSIIDGQIKGNNLFHNLVIDSTKSSARNDGARLVLQENSTQGIKGTLTFSTGSGPLTITSSGNGIARIDLQQSASQQGDPPTLIVKNVHSIGKTICVSASSTLENAAGFNPNCGGGNGDPAFGNISYNGFVNGVIRPAFIQLKAAQVVITAETLGLPDPRVSLKRLSDSSTIAFNDNCDNPQISDLIGRPLQNPATDSCIVQTLQPDAYYFEVTGKNTGSSGDVITAVTQPLGSDAALLNISYNGFVSPAGVRPAFIVFNAGKIVITAERFGTSSLPNPRAALKRISDGGTIASNDNCNDPNIANLIGRPLNTPQDACIVIDNLAPGSYYVEVTDTGGGSGDALIGATQIMN